MAHDNEMGYADLSLDTFTSFPYNSRQSTK